MIISSDVVPGLYDAVWQAPSWESLLLSQACERAESWSGSRQALYRALLLLCLFLVSLSDLHARFGGQTNNFQLEWAIFGGKVVCLHARVVYVVSGYIVRDAWCMPGVEDTLHGACKVGNKWCILVVH